MKKIIVGLLSATALVFAVEGSYAAEQKQNDASVISTIRDVKSGTYKIEPNHTQVLFAVLHFGFSYYSGNFSDVSGTLKFDAKDVTNSRLAIDLPIQSIQTTSEKLTEELKEPTWFDAKQYPTAHFVSTKVIKTGNETADVNGNLTLHGVTKPITLHIAYVGAGINPMDNAYTLGFQITGKINRGEFGIKTYIPKVGSDVALTIAAAFEKIK